MLVAGLSLCGVWVATLLVVCYGSCFLPVVVGDVLPRGWFFSGFQWFWLDLLLFWWVSVSSLDDFFVFSRWCGGCGLHVFSFLFLDTFCGGCWFRWLLALGYGQYSDGVRFIFDLWSIAASLSGVLCGGLMVLG